MVWLSETDNEMRLSLLGSTLGVGLPTLPFPRDYQGRIADRLPLEFTPMAQLQLVPDLVQSLPLPILQLCARYAAEELCDCDFRTMHDGNMVPRGFHALARIHHQIFPSPSSSSSGSSS